MKCKHCPANEAKIEKNEIYSSYLCLGCGYYYKKEGSKEIELNPYCLLILDNTYYETISTRKKLLIVLRTLRKSTNSFNITLKKYKNGSYLVKKLLI